MGDGQEGQCQQPQKEGAADYQDDGKAGDSWASPSGGTAWELLPSSCYLLFRIRWAGPSTY